MLVLKNISNCVFRSNWIFFFIQRPLFYKTHTKLAGYKETASRRLKKMYPENIKHKINEDIYSITDN